MIKKFILMIFAALILLSSIPNIEAPVGVGASPATLHFSKMLRGGYAEGFITVSVGKDEFVGVTATPRGSIATWFFFPEGSSFEVNRANPKRIKFIVQPPSDAPNGVYSSVIGIQTSPLGDPGEGVGTSIQVGVDVKVTVEITDLQFLQCDANSFQIKSAEEGQPILFSTNVLNTGNVRVTPEIDITILNNRQDRILKELTIGSGRELLPTVSEPIFFNIPSDGLRISQYWAGITVNPCGETKLLTFDVAEIGSLSTDGVLRTIITKVWADIGEITSVEAIFVNKGESSVKAKFIGKVELGGRIIEILESSEVIVAPGQETTLTTFFTPEEPGRYVVRGKVMYGTKETFENTGIINVAGVRYNYLLITIYALVVALLIFIIYRLYKRKARFY